MSPEIGVTVKVFSEVVFAEPHRPTRLLSPQQTFRTFRPDNCAAAAATKGKVFTLSHFVSPLAPTVKISAKYSPHSVGYCWILLDIVHLSTKD